MSGHVRGCIGPERRPPQAGGLQQTTGVLTGGELAATQGPFVAGVLAGPVNPPVDPRHDRPEEKEQPGDALHAAHEHVTPPEVGDLVYNHGLQFVRPNELAPR